MIHKIWNFTILFKAIISKMIKKGISTMLYYHVIHLNIIFLKYTWYFFHRIFQYITLILLSCKLEVLIPKLSKSRHLLVLWFIWKRLELTYTALELIDLVQFTSDGLLLIGFNMSSFNNTHRNLKGSLSIQSIHWNTPIVIN